MIRMLRQWSTWAPGTTNVAIVNGTIIAARAERVGSSDIDSAIMDRFRRHRGLTIGILTAERIKLELSSALEPKDTHQKMEVRGRDVQTGSPGAVNVTVGEVYAVTLPIIRRIAEEVRSTLTELLAEVAGDIYDRGLILTGGGALLPGLAQYLQKEIGLTVSTLPTIRGWQSCVDWRKCTTSPYCYGGWRAPKHIR